jgi:hypothetical protein
MSRNETDDANNYYLTHFLTTHSCYPFSPLSVYSESSSSSSSSPALFLALHRPAPQLLRLPALKERDENETEPTGGSKI